MTALRDRKTSFVEFSAFIRRLSLVLACEVSRELRVKKRTINTPLTRYSGSIISHNIVLIPILRAGLGMVEGFKSMYPQARVSHIGIYRDEETLEAIKYYFRFPKNMPRSTTVAFILDPMLATGGSVNCAVAELKKRGVKKIIIVSIVSAPEGIAEVTRLNRGIKIYTCALDKKLNRKGYIIPGLGDAGDRMFGT